MSTEKTGNKRLLKLAELLKKLPPKRFDYNVWVGDDWQGAPDLSCGTTACALGWATTIPSLRRIGLRMVKDQYSGHIELKDDPSGDAITAGMQVFVISKSEAIFLFGGGRGTAKQVAEKIEKFVAART